MRVPFDKPYRAFPELDEFTDAECVRFVAAARRHHRLSGLLLPLLYIPALVVTCPAGFFLPLGINWLLGLGDARSDDVAVMFVYLFSIGAVAGAFALGSLFVRDVRLRKIIGEQLKGAACRGCGYSMLGLPVTGHFIICPECGKPFDLRETDLTAEELISRPIGVGAPAAKV